MAGMPMQAASDFSCNVGHSCTSHEDLRWNPIHLALSPYRAGSDVSALRCSCKTTH